MPVGDTVQREPNQRLSGARRERRLTQDQLAQAVREVYWRLFEKEAAIDAEHVSKLERGIITWPNARYRAALREVLGADTDAELGFYYRHPRDTVEAGADAREVDTARRDEFISLVAGLGTGACLGVSGLSALPDPVREVLARAAEPADPPSRVGCTEVQQVRFATELFRSWRGRYGGGACREPLFAQLRWAAGLLRGQAEDTIRPELYSAVGSLAQVAGWGDIDAGYHDTARQQGDQDVPLAVDDGTMLDDPEFGGRDLLVTLARIAADAVSEEEVA
jgi:transcriptional regulator with XRE-family HTH domain